MCMHHVCLVPLKAEKMVSLPLELELARSHYMGAKNWTWNLCEVLLTAKPYLNYPLLLFMTSLAIEVL